MREKSPEGCVAAQIKLLRKYLKVKIQEDNVTFQNHAESRNHVYDLIKRCVLHGESHSALVIGPRGCGKTTMINSVLHQLSKEADLEKDAIIVRLNGLIHHDEKVALKSITAQMQLENAVDGKVFGTFADQLSFLLSCLRAADRRSRSMVFLLDECDLFCRAGRTQTLLYNLFDVTQLQQAPMCVLGITNRLDVMDLLEKRVKSRFSHRHIFIFPNEQHPPTPATTPRDPPSTPRDRHRELMRQLLSVPVRREVKKRGRKSTVSISEMDTDQDVPAIPEEVFRRCDIDSKVFAALEPSFLEEWNAHVSSVVAEEAVGDAVEKFCYYMANQQVFRNVLFQLVCKLSPSRPYITATDFVSLVESATACEDRIAQLRSLSALELSLVVSALHSAQTLDQQPVNFEMVLHRYNKFAMSNSMQGCVPRALALKAYEHLLQLEILVPAASTHGTTHKEHRLHWVSVPPRALQAAARGRGARHLPTEILHWLDNHIG